MHSEIATRRIILAGLYIFFLLMIFQNLIKTYFKNEYLFVGYILGAFLLFLVFIFTFVKKTDVKICDLDWLIIFYIIIQLIWMLPGFYQNPRGVLMGFLYNIRNFLMPYAIIRLSAAGLKSQEMLIKWMVFLIAVVAVVGIYIFYFDIEFISGLTKYGVSLAGRRAESFLFTSLDVAFSSMIFGLIAFAYLIEKNRVFGWAAKLLYAGVFLFCLILTFTRSAYIGFLAGFMSIILLYLIKININWKIVVAVILISIIIITAGVYLLIDKVLVKFPDLAGRIVTTDDFNTLAHIENNAEALKIFLKNPFGIGLGMTGWTVSKWQLGKGIYIESSFLQVMVETGIAGIIVLMAIWIKIMFISISNYFKTRNPLFLGVFGATLAAITGSFFLPVFYYSTAMSFYWGLVAISIFFRDKEDYNKIYFEVKGIKEV